MFLSSHNILLVLSALAVAILTSYTALDMASRITAAVGRAARWWLLGGACVMGAGVWAMHFAGLMAFGLPEPSAGLGYDPVIALVSLLLAIISSGLGLWLVCQRALPWRRLVVGALVMGVGLVAMHYTGMAAMQMAPSMPFDPIQAILPVVIAVVASGAALSIAFRLRRPTPKARIWRLDAAVVMGFAIVGMHYAGVESDGASAGRLALVVSVLTLIVLTSAWVVSIIDLRLEERTVTLAGSLAEANRELTYMALHDNLTKLPNRALLSDRIGQAIIDADRGRGGFALMFIDLDGFKMVNDVYGHYAGDQLLKQIVQRIGEGLRPQDTLARVGGDEFVLLCKVDSITEVAETATRLLRGMRDPCMVDSRELRVSGSIGIATYPGDGATQSELLTHADAAMYHAKSMGGNIHCFFETSMNADVQEQLQLIQDLRVALERDELVLHYLPKFNVVGQSMTGVEALLRWQHPTRGLLSPDNFVPLAEKAGLIVPIGEWVLDETCRQLAEWQRTGCEDWTVAVNLSSLQFNHAGLVKMVRVMLARHDLDPKCLILEVAENTAMQNANSSIKILQQLHDLGVNISIDDFGTGYSSLLYLRHLPGSELKIDRGFIRDLARDSEGAAIVSAVVALGQTLNLKVVAEGVETEAQQKFLAELGCDALQGFLLGQPMPASELSAHYRITPANSE